MAKTICVLCGEKLRDESALISCPICNAPLGASQGETVLKKTECTATISGDVVAGNKGTLFLTNQRIFWIGPAVTVVNLSNSATQAILNRGIKKGASQQMRFSFSLDEVTDIELLKKGPFKMLQMTIATSEIIVFDMKSKFIQEWIDAVTDAKKSFAR